MLDLLRLACFERHSRSGEFPPIALALLSVAELAVARAQAGDWDSLLRLPSRFPREAATVSEALEALDLAAYVRRRPR